MAQAKVGDKGWVDAKWFLKSKTVWLNILALLVPLLDIFLKTNLIKDKDVYALVLAIFNLLLRFKTNKPITFSQ